MIYCKYKLFKICVLLENLDNIIMIEKVAFKHVLTYPCMGQVIMGGDT